jgi:thiamine-monophosphate kinase
MSDLGEFGFIDALSARLQPQEGGIGIGDDAAAWEPTPGCSTVATTDMLVESIHFNLDWTTPEDLGWKALAVNLSDLAAMGARPGRALVSVAMAPGHVDLILRMYEGMSELAHLTGTRIVGGDTVRTPGPLVINVALMGEADPGRLLRRSGARPGDLLALTGAVGASAAGLDLLLRNDLATQARPEAAALLSAHHRPWPQLAAGAALARLGLRCAIDVSDGVASEAAHLARASEVAIEIEVELLPLAPGAVALLGIEQARHLALSGGEDYQLLFAVPESRFDEARAAFPADGTPIVIGRVTGEAPGGSVTLTESGRRVQMAAPGYTAF